jgi:apolipoprotein D and lipocalin family protein
MTYPPLPERNPVIPGSFGPRNRSVPLTTTRNLLLAGAGGLLIAALSATAVLAMTHKPAAHTPAKAVDADKLFNGRWAEIGRTPMKLTDGCVAGATTYTKVSATRVNVRDTCQDKTPTGKEKAIGGPGKILDPGTNTKLHVSYRVFGFIPLGRDYWILDHDDDYTWFISRTCGSTRVIPGSDGPRWTASSRRPRPWATTRPSWSFLPSLRTLRWATTARRSSRWTGHRLRTWSADHSACRAP